MFPTSWFLWASSSNLFSFFFKLQPLCSAGGMVPKAKWAVGSPTWTPKTAWPRTPGMHKKFQEQSKSIQSHSSEDPPTMVLCGTIPPWTLFAVFLSCTMPCLPPAHVCILGWTSPECCYLNAAGAEHNFLPNAVYKSSLPTCKIILSWFPLLYLPFYSRCYSRHSSSYMLLTEGRTAGLQELLTSRVLHLILNEETAKICAKAKAKKKKEKRKRHYHWFSNFPKLWRALSCLKPTFLIKSLVVALETLASREQSFRPLLELCNMGLIKQHGSYHPASKIIHLPQVLIDFLAKRMWQQQKTLKIY